MRQDRERRQSTIVVHPPLGTGLETRFDRKSGEVTRTFRLLGLRVPLKRHIPFSRVARVAVVPRSIGPAQNDRVGMGAARMQAYVFEVALVLEGGKLVKLGKTTGPSHPFYSDRKGALGTAEAIAAELKRFIGLPTTSN